MAGLLGLDYMNLLRWLFYIFSTYFDLTDHIYFGYSCTLALSSCL